MNNYFKKLWNQYVKVAPSAQVIYDDINKIENKVVKSDHIAIRTIAHPEIGIDVIEKVFLNMGYEKCDTYDFKQKKLTAFHYEHKDESFPKVFISELRYKELSKEAQEVAEKIIKNIKKDMTPEELLLSGTHWEKSHLVYEETYKESEYLAWFYCFGFLVNHFAVFLNDTKNFNSMDKINDWLINTKGFRMNESGGLIKGSEEAMLEQSSIMAEKVTLTFQDGDFEVPSCYYEFAKRYPKETGELYTGFVTTSADKIFESTNK